MTKTPIEERDYLTAEETSRVLDLHVESVRRLAREGRMQAIQIGIQLRFSKSEVDKIKREGLPRRKATQAERDAMRRNPNRHRAGAVRLNLRSAPVDSEGGETD